ncbi:MAG: peptidyl-prolyl cis-trans isomerase, partial [Chitinispirillales bacterium]|nr:peptidyl-prolyl cis-trans isomerase [Chitinispirillales bacterium]
LTLALTLSAPSCQREQASKKPEGPIVARVGSAYLTLEELNASIPAEYSDVITREQNIQYVGQWINTELLYQEALRLKISEEPEIKARLEKMRKDLLSAEVISRGASKGGAEVSEQAVREYYETNREQFVRDHNVARYEDILVEDLNVAWEVRRTATPETFKSLAKTHSKVPVGLDDGVPYVAIDAIPPVVRTAVLSAAVPSITGPYRSDEGFHILRVVGRFDKGTIASLDEVRDEIVSRLSNIAQKGESERLISDIRSKADVEFNADLVPGSGGAKPADGAGAEAKAGEAGQ